MNFILSIFYKYRVRNLIWGWVVGSTRVLSQREVHGKIRDHPLSQTGATYSNKQGLLYPTNGGYPSTSLRDRRPLPKSNLRHFMIVPVS